METRIYFHKNTYANLDNLKSAKNITNKGILTSFRKALFSILILLILAFLSNSCKQNQQDSSKSEPKFNQKDSLLFNSENTELAFFNVDNKKLSNEDFENLICSGQYPRNEYLLEDNIYQNLLVPYTDKNAKVLFTQSAKQNPLRVYLTHLETDLCKLSGFTLIGNQLISIFYISNFEYFDLEELNTIDKVLVILTKDENKYYTTLLISECGVRECGYLLLNEKDKEISQLQNIKNYKDFMMVYKSD